MTLTTLLIGIGLFAILLTGIEKAFGHRKLIKHLGITFLQNFVGALFVFSGFVKVVDPLGTAYKLEQYFAEFESTFAGTKAAFLAPLFPAMTGWAVELSVFVVVLEIVLGIALLIGASRKLSAWIFFLLVAFFTFLTGFTYLTGYVGEGVNFFEFSKWGSYVETNMKVTDCGCFGDFLKLEPFVSFLKDVFLLIPGVLFLLFHKQMHQLFTPTSRNWVMGLSTVGLVVYAMSNYVWNLPDIDFRPFAEGVNIRERKALEEESEGNVKVIAYKMTNKANGEVLELAFDKYLAEYAKYPAEEWDLEQVRTEPEIPRTKLSDFEVSDLTGNDVTEDILTEKGNSMMIVAYKLYGTETSKMITVPDSVFVTDTLITQVDTTLSRRLLKVNQREVKVTEYQWDADYLERWKTHFLPQAEAALAKGVRVYAVTAYSDPARIADFQKALSTSIPFYMGDDILLKTIIRSNPGPVLMRDGTVIKKWHYKKMPTFEAIASEYLK